jgi:hypothetical protein
MSNLFIHTCQRYNKIYKFLFFLNILQCQEEEDKRKKVFLTKRTY